MIRATFIIYGDVQKSHYRGRVIRIAQKMGITGTIQNLVNGTVKIIARKLYVANLPTPMGYRYGVSCAPTKI